MENNAKDTRSNNDFDKIVELKQQQNELQHQIRYLSRKRPWYMNIGNWIGILGIIIAFFIFYFSRNHKELQISISTKPQYLLQDNGFIGSNLKIFSDSLILDDVALYKIEIKNIGNTGISSSDFVEGPLFFGVKLNDSTNIMTRKLLRVVEEKYQDNYVNEVFITNKNIPATFDYQPSLLNSGESILLYLYTTCTKPLDISAKGRILNGEVSINRVNNIILQKISNYPEKLRNILGGKFWGRIIPLLIFIIFSYLLFLYYDKIYFVITGTDEKIALIAFIFIVSVSGIWSICALFF